VVRFFFFLFFYVDGARKELFSLSLSLISANHTHHAYTHTHTDSVLLGGIVAKTFGGGWGLVWTPWFFAFLIGLIVTLVLQTHFQNRAMQMGENMAIFPVFQAFWITFGVVSGLYFYNTDKDWGESFWKASGIAPMILGIAFLFQHPKREKIWRTQSMALSREQLERLGIPQGRPVRMGSGSGATMTNYIAVDDGKDEEEDNEEGLNSPKVVIHVGHESRSSSNQQNDDDNEDERKHNNNDDDDKIVSSSNNTIRM